MLLTSLATSLAALIEPRAHGDAFERVKDACKWEPRVR